MQNAEISSFCILHSDFPYQLALRTPGMCPWSASLRKQMRHTPNFRYTARGRPQSRHRRLSRVEYFGFFKAFAIFDLLAI